MEPLVVEKKKPISKPNPGNQGKLKIINFHISNYHHVFTH